MRWGILLFIMLILSVLFAQSPKDQIAFVSEVEGTEEIFVVCADGSGLAQLTKNNANDYNPKWSPDGKLIAFVSERDGNTEIYIMNADGSNQRNVSNNPAQDWDPRWTKEGKLLFLTNRNRYWEVFQATIGEKGIEITPLAAGLKPEEVHLCWSPDGSKICEETDRTGNWEIYIGDADGKQLVNVTNNPADDYDPCWDYSGTRIAFISNRDGDNEVFIYDLNTKKTSQVTNNNVNDASPQWRPPTK